MALSKELAKVFETSMRDTVKFLGAEQRLLMTVRGSQTRDGREITVITDQICFRADFLLNKKGLSALGRNYLGGDTVSITLALEGADHPYLHLQ